MRLARQIRQLGYLAAQLCHGVGRGFGKPAGARQPNAQPPREAYVNAFEYVFCTGGALWAADAQGEVCFIKPKHLPVYTAMRELLEYLGVPLLAAEDCEKERAWIGQLATAYELGLPLTMQYLRRASQAKYRQGCPGCARRPQGQCSEPQTRQGEQCRERASSGHGSIDGEANGLPKNQFGHGGTSAVE